MVTVMKAGIAEVGPMAFCEACGGDVFKAISKSHTQYVQPPRPPTDAEAVGLYAKVMKISVLDFIDKTDEEKTELIW